MYHYWGFGLKILSEIQFPELVPFEFNDTPDVNIKIGSTPEKLSGPDVVNRVRVSINPTEYLLNFLNLADYYVTGGNSVIVNPLPGADQESIRLFLLDNAMAAILHQRDMIPLKASAINYKDGIALICGNSTSGKSTALTLLKQKGYKIFSDDACVLKYDTERNAVTVYPSCPVVSLWEDSLEKLGFENVGQGIRLRPDLPKYARYYHDEFDPSAKNVKSIFLLDRGNKTKDVEIKKIGTIAAFKEIQQLTCHPIQMNAMKKRNIHFDIITKLIPNIPIYKISRSENKNTAKQLIDLIEQNLPSDND